MRNFAENVLSDPEVTPAKARIVWSRMHTAAGELLRTAKGTISDLTGHIAGVKKEIQKEKIASENQRVRDEAKAQRDILKQRVQEMRGNKRSADDSAYPIMALPAETFEQITIHTGADGKPDISLPFILKQHPAVSQLMKDTSNVLTQFSTKYQKEPDFATAGKTGRLLAPGGGMDETNQCFNDIMSDAPKVDISSVSTAFPKQAWTWGYADTFKSIGPAPNSAAVCRVAFAGSTRYLVGPTKKLVDALKAAGHLVVGSNSIAKIISCMPQEQARALVSEHGAKLYHGVMEKYECLYVPMAWTLIEAVQTGPLVFGTRKSFILKTADSPAEYSFMMELLKNDGVNVGKMVEVQKVLAA